MWGFLVTCHGPLKSCNIIVKDVDKPIDMSGFYISLYRSYGISSEAILLVYLVYPRGGTWVAGISFAQ